MFHFSKNKKPQTVRSSGVSLVTIKRGEMKRTIFSFLAITIPNSMESSIYKKSFRDIRSAVAAEFT